MKTFAVPGGNGPALCGCWQCCRGLVLQLAAQAAAGRGARVCMGSSPRRELSVPHCVSERQGFTCIFKDLLYGFDTIYFVHQVHHHVSLLPTSQARELPADQCTGSVLPVDWMLLGVDGELVVLQR